MPQTSGDGVNLRKILFQLGKEAVNNAGEEIKDKINQFKASKSGDDGKSLSTAQSLDIQFMVGEYSNLTQAVTGIEKAMKQSIESPLRNAQQ